MRHAVDAEVLRVAEENKCVVTTKDSDFTTSFWLNHKPEKLLLISTGNVKNIELEEIFDANFEQIVADLTTNRFVELTREHVIVHA